MLKAWGLTNFKSIYNMEKDLEFAPLTVLTGTNSSGKSTFIQSILLIAQTMQNKFYNPSLVLNGDFVDLGQFDDIRSRTKQDGNQETKPVGIRWSYKCKGNIERKHHILYNSKTTKDEQYAELELDEFKKDFLDASEEDVNYDDERIGMLSEKEYILNFDLEFDSFHPKEEDIKRYQKEQFAPRIISVKQKIIDLEYNNDEFIYTLYAKEDSNININNINNTSDETMYPFLKTSYHPLFGSNDSFLFPVRVVHFWPERIYFSIDELDKLSTEKQNFNKYIHYKYFEACYREFGDIFSKFKYLGPLRYRDSYYPFSKAADTKDVGVKGEYTAAVFNLYKEEKVEFISPKYLNTNALDKIKIIKKSLSESLKEWLNYFCMASKIETEIIKHGYELKSNSINISHVGTGVSQVLPILVSCLLAEKNTTLIFEQPELHLHPKVQSRLADFFLSMALIGKQCIIETHSEYFIDKLRLRICQSLLDKNEEIKKITKIYYFDKNQMKTKIKEIEVNEYGDYSTWPEGFFDERQWNSREILKSIDEKMFKEIASEDSVTHND